MHYKIKTSHFILYDTCSRFTHLHGSVLSRFLVRLFLNKVSLWSLSCKTLSVHN